jgi:hypothetical protein
LTQKFIQNACKQAGFSTKLQESVLLGWQQCKTAQVAEGSFRFATSYKDIFETLKQHSRQKQPALGGEYRLTKSMFYYKLVS